MGWWFLLQGSHHPAGQHSVVVPVPRGLGQIGRVFGTVEEYLLKSGQTAQRFVPSRLENIRGWRTHRLPGLPVPEFDCHHVEDFLPCLHLQPLSFQLPHLSAMHHWGAQLCLVRNPLTEPQHPPEVSISPLSLSKCSSPQLPFSIIFLSLDMGGKAELWGQEKRLLRRQLGGLYCKALKRYKVTFAGKSRRVSVCVGSFKD